MSPVRNLQSISKKKSHKASYQKERISNRMSEININNPADGSGDIDVEAHYERVKSAKLIAVAELTFAIGWLAGKK